MPIRSSNAIWQGSIGDGSGMMSFGSGAYEGSYSVPSRFEEEDGTNPEELIAAAHAGCYSMALSAGLTRNGTPPTKISTTASVHIEKQDVGWRIVKIELKTEAQVPDVDEATFMEQAEDAKKNCPVSQALGAVPEITLDATLVS